MRLILPLLLLTVWLPACTGLDTYVSSALIKADSDKPLPGLEPLYQRRPATAAAAGIAAPLPPAPETLPFPPRLLTEEEAEAALAGDAPALRFLAVRRLAEAGLIPPEDAARRAATNLGALLPLTASEPPAAGLLAAVPPPSQVEQTLRGLWFQPASRDQRDFLAEKLLPRAPAQRQKLAIADKSAAARALERLPRLQEAGLITLAQRQAETAAVRGLLDSGALPDPIVAAPLPPPEPPKPKKSAGRGDVVGGGAGKGMQRLPGGVSGDLVVVPSPLELNAPAVPAGFAGQVGIHLLSMGSAGHAEQAWAALTAEHPQLSGLTYKVVRVDLGELGVTHRLIAGPLTMAKAGELCAALRPKGQTCQPTPFPP